MAKKPDLNSDFAQKLLGDIRRRKEKLGFGSSNTHQADCHKSYRGSREKTKNNNFLPQNNNNTIVKPNNTKGFSSPKRNNKQIVTPKTSSQAIVPFQADKKPVRDKIDVSMALALALSKSGKLQNIELLSRTKIGTDFVTRRGSIQFSNSNSDHKFGSNGSQYLFLPEFGIEKLNEMINAYTRNRNFRDLEECLNMLIMMQDAQDCMVGSKTSSSNYNYNNKNSKILLLKDKEDEEKESRNKSKNQNKLEKNGLNARRNRKQENNLLGGISASKSYNKYNCSNSNKMNSECNNKRMPGLVARLMGLEEFPQPVKSNVKIKEVEMDIKNEILNEKYAKNRENVERKRIKSKHPSEQETKLERITRSYIDDKRRYSEKGVKYREKSKAKKIEEKIQVVKTSVDKKLRNKDNSYLNDRSKEKMTITPKKIAEKFDCNDKDLRKKGLDGISSQKEKNSSTVSSGEINKTKNDNGLENNGCKNSEKIIEMDQNLKELKKKIEEEFECKLENFEENNTSKDGCKINNAKTNNGLENGCKIDGEVIEIDQNLKELKKEIEEFECKLENYEENNANKDGCEINNAKNNKGLENGCKIDEKIIELDENLNKIEKEIEEEFEAKLEHFEENNAKKDANVKTNSSDDQRETINCKSVTGTDIDAQQIILVPFLKEQEIKLHDLDEQTDSCNYTIESRKLHSYEDSFNEDQILLREILLKDTQFLDLAQNKFKIEIALHSPQFQEITEPPLEKETKTLLLHTVHEILKRKGEKYDLICTNFKFETLNSLIKELDSDFKNLEFKFDCETFEILRQMLQREIEGRNPDSNCMWEFGWDSKYFARLEKCEIAKDLEKHLVSGLITELTKDLIEEIVLI